MNLETLEISLQSLEERPDPKKLDYLRQEARQLMTVHGISAETYSELLVRFRGVKDSLNEHE
jgi:hypothetical protein